MLAALTVGCRFFDGQLSDLVPPGLADPAKPAPPSATGTVPNPLVVAVPDPEFFWNQLVDTIDDYFDLRTEQRIHVIGGVITEGRVETYYQPAATLLEPWRWDSTSGYEKLHATTQSLRPRVGAGDSQRTTVCRARHCRKRARRRRSTGVSHPRFRAPAARRDSCADEKPCCPRPAYARLDPFGKGFYVGERDSRRAVRAFIQHAAARAIATLLGTYDSQNGCGFLIPEAAATILNDRAR